MPVILQGTCASCGHKTPSCLDSCGAVYLDEPPDEPYDKVTHQEEPRLVILGHPCEMLILEDLGYTYESASAEGRLVLIEHAYCLDCGEGFEIRRLTVVNPAGCVGFLVLLGLTLCTCVTIGIVANVWLGMLIAWLMFYVGVTVHTALGKKRDKQRLHTVLQDYPERAKAVATPTACPSCGSESHQSPGAIRKPIPCKKCGERAMAFRMVGKS